MSEVSLTAAEQTDPQQAHDSWICSMISAREHYALPLALHRSGRLARLYTDIWAGPMLSRLRFGPAVLRSLAARGRREIPRQKVVSFTAATLRRRLTDALSHKATRDFAEHYHRYAEEGREFALRVVRDLERNWDQLRPAGLLGYDTGCLETQEWLSERGIPSIIDQIDPARCEEEIVRREAEKWSGWQSIPGRIPERYFRRLEEEWRLASRVIVNSAWSRDALIQQGVSGEKIVVIPLCYEPASQALPRRIVGSERTLTVLWLGQVILRKGIQYLIEAARTLGSRGIHFIIAGPIGISKVGLDAAPSNMSFVGPVSRSQVAELYRSADLFVLPTLSDGFAITQLEAMAHGLPVVTTPHCGEVVSDGADGRIVPAGDADALAATIEELNVNRARLAAMSHQAMESVKKFSLMRNAAILEKVLGEVSGVPMKHLEPA